jgi:hypothetical protein
LFQPLPDNENVRRQLHQRLAGIEKVRWHLHQRLSDNENASLSAFLPQQIHANFKLLAAIG